MPHPCRLVARALVARAILVVLSTAPVASAVAPPGAYKCEADLIEVMFAAESRVRLRQGAPLDLATSALEGVDRVLARVGAHEWSRLCDVPEERLDEMQARGAAKGMAVYNLNNIWRLRFSGAKDGLDVWDLCRELEALPGVLRARPVPLPMPAPLPPDYQPSQNYEDPAGAIPTGVDAEYIWTLAGGDGSGVTVCDLEYSWNYNHEDVTKALGSQINTNVADPFGNNNHGTAVVGELVSDDNAPNWGTKGVCFGSGLLTCGTYFGVAPSWNVPGALAVAIANLGPGDIILLEQQWDHTGSNGYVPIEWWTDYWPNPQSFNAVYAAIANAIANDIHVVEAGGNGSVDTDLFSWFGDSGAIIVGAGGAYAGGTAVEGNLERLGFSSYGSRFNLQGWGEDVVTTGYGNLFNSEGVNRRYTHTFNGTSSASPIVAGAMACVQGYYLANISATPLSPAAMRTLLVTTGTPQAFGPTGNIGPRPNCLAAVQTLSPPIWVEWGDAPENAIAYPSLGVLGRFPTCSTTGAPGTFVAHGPAPIGYFGPSVDFEADGNAGNCPLFPPFDADECFADPDAGLLFPPAYTIDPAGLVEVSCNGQTGCLGPACTFASWGVHVDIALKTGADPVYVNVLMDFDQSGTWGGSSPCLAGLAGEHVLVNFLVPPGYTGPLSALGPPGFTLGPRPGYVWTRFTLSDTPVPAAWDGRGTFGGGETCDYMLCIDAAPMEYGDAPEGAPAYPWAGTLGFFPTCSTIGPAGFVAHTSSGLMYFGGVIDLEPDGNAGNCPAFPPYDMDECHVDLDSGLLQPTAYTIDPLLNPVPCPGPPALRLAYACHPAVWGVDVDIQVTNGTGADAFVNVLVDWDQSGSWGGFSPCPNWNADEHALVNFIVPAGFSGPLSLLGPPPLLAGLNSGHVWTRFTVSDSPVLLGWDGAGTFLDGTTSDFLLLVDPDPTAVAEIAPLPAALRIASARPNPFREETTIQAEIPAAGKVAVQIYDVSGRSVRNVFRGERPAGRHSFVWDGRDAEGRRVAAGVYFVRVVAGTEAVNRPVVLMR